MHTLFCFLHARGYPPLRACSVVAVCPLLTDFLYNSTCDHRRAHVFNYIALYTFLALQTAVDDCLERVLGPGSGPGPGAKPASAFAVVFFEGHEQSGVQDALHSFAERYSSTAVR